jgi:molecular chaperone DnaK
VVTVPAYFTHRQRQAVKMAGELIDLEVVSIINEPTAAAMAYGIGKKLDQRVLVYDLGGGTFDVSIIEIRDRVFEVKATGGDIFLGGIDFDNAMIAYVLADFRRLHGVDLSSDPVAMQRIKDLAERTKIDLSSRTEVPFSIPFITMTPQGQPLNIDMRFDRAVLEQLTEPLLDRSMEILARVLSDAGMTPAEIDKVMLVGGQTRMPAIQERLTSFFGRPPSKGVHPDEAVAIGAALYGWSLSAGGEQRLQLLDVIPMAIGIEQAGGEQRLQLLDVIPMAIGIEQAGGGTHVVFGHNAPIPNARAISATNSHDGQTELVLRIVQGDHVEARRNEMLGEFTFSGVRPCRAGEVRLEVLFEVNVEGILSVHARDLDTGREMRSTVRVTQT